MKEDLYTLGPRLVKSSTSEDPRLRKYTVLQLEKGSIWLAKGQGYRRQDQSTEK